MVGRSERPASPCHVTKRASANSQLGVHPMTRPVSTQAPHPSSHRSAHTGGRPTSGWRPSTNASRTSQDQIPRLPTRNGQYRHRTPGSLPQVVLAGLLCRFCGGLRRCRAACGAVPPRSRAPSASLRDGARATLDLRASTAPPGRQGPALHNARHHRRHR